MLSYLRPTTGECMNLVTRGHFRSRDKDSGHIIWFAISENSMQHTKFTALCFVEPDLLPIEVLHCGNRDVPSLLLMWPWPLPDDLHTRAGPRFPRYALDVRIWTSYVKAFESYRLTDRQRDRQTGPKLYSMPLVMFGKLTVWNIVISNTAVC